jgi:hypothetical protein
MKRFITTACLSFALAGAGFAQLPGYTNYGTVSAVIDIQATNFVNLGIFAFPIAGIDFGPYTFSDVVTFTNRNEMDCDLGFEFDTEPATSSDPPVHPAAGFENDNPGEVYAGSQVFLSTVGVLTFETGTFPEIIINATNIKSSGLLDAGEAGRIGITGNGVDLSRGVINVEGLDQASQLTQTGTLGPGVFETSEAIGTVVNGVTQGNVGEIIPQNGLADTPAGFPAAVQFGIENAQAIALTNIISLSNIVTQVLVYGDSLGEVPITASFNGTGGDFQDEIVAWQSTVIDAYGNTINNNFYLTDDLGEQVQSTNKPLALTNDLTLATFVMQVPNNFTLDSVNPGGSGNQGNAVLSMNLFTNAFGTNAPFGSTNQYSFLGAVVADVTDQPNGGVAGSIYSNVPGRTEITANQTLDLTLAKITAGNYLNITATNHYAGSAGAQTEFPYADFTLASTNGQLSISNLVAPFDPHINGPINCLSMIWTNFTPSSNILTNITGMGTTNAATNVVTNLFTITNRFQILMVSSSLQPTTEVFVDNLSLRSTNVFISDDLNVQSNLLINAQNLTITSNDPGDVTPEGELILTGINNLYSAQLPSVQNFTNFGIVDTPNAGFFQLRQDPTGARPGDGPWQSFVNYNEVLSGGGDVFWVNSFVNAGSTTQDSVIEAESGPVSVQAITAGITNSVIVATAGDMSFTCGSLLVTNSILEANGIFAEGNGLFDLSVTNLLSDGSIPGNFGGGNSGNAWQSGDGFSLLVAPQSGDLLGTSITSSCLPTVQCENVWAGVPQNNISSNVPTLTNNLPIMSNNVPIGQLVLDGGNTNSIYHFKGPDTVNPYAIYVDQLQLTGGATNTKVTGTNTVYTAFKIDPNVNIYFLDAVSGATDISAQLNGSASNHLHWLPNYVGFFSKTNITFPDHNTFAFNRGLALSGYNITEPLVIPLTPQSINLTITATNVGPATRANISWYAPAGSSSTLYTKAFSAANWQTYTNIVQGTNAGRLSVTAGISSTNCVYRVNVSQ